jgi:hypothetical protein
MRGYFLKETANVEQGDGPRHLGGPSSTVVRRCADDQKHVPDPPICEHIINTAKFETMRHIEINCAISRQREVDTPEIEL